MIGMVAAFVYLGSGFIPTKIEASTPAPSGVPVERMSPALPVEYLGPSLRSPYFANAFWRAFTNISSDPETTTPVEIWPAANWVDVLSNGTIHAALSARNNCFPSSSASASSPYDPTSTFFPAKSARDSAICSSWSFRSLRGWIWASNWRLDASNRAISNFWWRPPIVSTMNSNVANNASSARLRISSFLPTSFSPSKWLSSSATPRQTPTLQSSNAIPNAYLAQSHWSLIDIGYISILSLVAFSHFCLRYTFCFSGLVRRL
jgi:hypothetical protein